MHAGLPRLCLTFCLTLCCAACHAGATAPLLDETSARALWDARGPTHYAYMSLQTGFFISLSGHPIRYEVRHDSVLSGTFLDTGQPVPGPYPATGFATINALFALAARARADHRLSAIAFDPVLGYPRRMDLAGPPDAAGSIFASELHALP